MQDQRNWMETMRRGLQGLRGQLPRLVESSESDSQRKGLQVLAGDVDVILEELEHMLDGQAGPPPTAAP
jgi:hypothetical protein